MLALLILIPCESNFLRASSLGGTSNGNSLSVFGDGGCGEANFGVDEDLRGISFAANSARGSSWMEGTTGSSFWLEGNLTRWSSFGSLVLIVF